MSWPGRSGGDPAPRSSQVQATPDIACIRLLKTTLLLVRRLPSWQRNVGKRLVKAPKVYVRDSGIAHALLGLRDQEIKNTGAISLTGLGNILLAAAS